MQLRIRLARRCSFFLFSMSLLATMAGADEGPVQFQLLPDFGGLNSAAPDANLRITARVRMAANSRVGMLEVTATMNESWHVYSITQPPGGPMKTTIKLAPSEDYRLLGSFAPDHAAHVHFIDVFDMDVEEHPGQVTWSVPFELSAAGTSSALVIKGHVEGQVCSDRGGCIPFGQKENSFSAKLSGTLSPSASSTLAGIRLPNTHGSIRGWLSTTKASPGDTVQLYVSIDPDKDWHVYAYAKIPPSLFQKPTLLETRIPPGWTTGPVATSAPVISTPSPLPNDPPTRYYAGPVTWSLPLHIPVSAQPGTYPLEGHVAFQTCAATCDAPTATAWQSKLQVVSAGTADTSGLLAAVGFSAQPSPYDSVVDRL
ncbi:MAG: protein-disulfide reductase DsbD family protein, partial [Acidobacteria bacterium]|nr:protein-disulfide reductase DsbD family protein [Acidobacteriota bacterium]